MGVLRNICLGLLTAAWCFFGSPALAEKRVALVIGNSAYQKAAKLANPVNDAISMTEMFKSAGFDLVESKIDLGANDLRRTLRDFGTESRDADVAVIYYAGHGIELDGNNFLIPVDAALETDAEVWDEAIPLDRVLYAVESAKLLRLVILDACRDNPFARTMKRTSASRAIGRGLARVEPTIPNTMVAFAAKAGSTSSDGDSRNSPFATALVEHLPKPGLDLRRAFGFVRDDVLKNTGNKQEPFVYGSLGGNDLPLVPARPMATAPQSDPQSTVRRDYELALELGSREGWAAFLSKYFEGFYADLAKGQLKKLAAEETRAAAAEKARLAEQEKVRLTTEGANLAEISRASEAAKAAEEARIAAERASQAAREKTADAERARLAAENARHPEPKGAGPAQLVAARATEETTQSRSNSDSATAISPDQPAAKSKSQADVVRTRVEKKKSQRAQEAAQARQLEEPARKRSMASAESGGAASTASRTCSQTRDQCRIDRRILGPASVAKCDPFFAQCMKTGVWHSGFNHFVGVLRR